MPPTVDELIAQYREYDKALGKGANPPRLFLTADFGLLVAEIERLREDKERLDWLDSTLGESDRFLVRRIAGSDSNPVSIEIQPHYPKYGVSFGHPNVREALDAARAQEQAGE